MSDEIRLEDKLVDVASSTTTKKQVIIPILLRSKKSFIKIHYDVTTGTTTTNPFNLLLCYDESIIECSNK